MARTEFGPPGNFFGAFAWAVMQLPRAVLWQVREKQLRELTAGAIGISAVVGITLFVGAIFAARPIADHLMHEAASWLVVVAVAIGLILLAGFMTWHLSNAIAAASLERMAIEVQRLVDGEAPSPTLGKRAVIGRAIRNVFPRVRSVMLWIISSVLAFGLALIPGVGLVLALIVQTVMSAVLLAHGTITDNRQRLGLPRRFLLREPALTLGLSVAVLPIVLVPPLAWISGGSVAIAGALVAVGSKRKTAASRGQSAKGDDALLDA